VLQILVTAKDTDQQSGVFNVGWPQFRPRNDRDLFWQIYYT